MQTVVDEHDLRLLTALQVSPRGSWAEIGPACDMHPVTASRRWEALSSAGLAWVHVTPGPRLLPELAVGYVDVDCAPANRLAVAEALCADPRVATIELTSTGRSMLITVMASSLHDLTTTIMERVDSLPGITSTRTSVLSRMYTNPSRWRLDALDRHTIDMLSRPTRETSATMSPIMRSLFCALSRDGRAPVSDLAAQVGSSASTVTRRLGAMISGQLVSLRCDQPPEVVGRPVVITYCLRVPPADTDALGRFLARVPECRAVSAVVGEADLLVDFWLPHIGHSHRVQDLMARQVPGLRILDRYLTVRVVKRMGRVLDADGLAVDTVPVNPWFATTADPA